MERLLEITAVPPGEAPLWVREAWVGLTVPLAPRRTAPLRLLTAGVLSGPRNAVSSLFAGLWGRLVPEEGYLVEAVAAVEALSQHNPAAAQWWQQNTPHLLRPRRYFLFQQGVGRVVERAES